MQKKTPLRKETLVLLDNAQRFLSMAESHFKNGFYEGVVFTSHRAIELSLKSAILELKKQSYPWGHDLLTFYSLVKNEIKLTSSQLTKLRRINAFYPLAEGYAIHAPMRTLFSRHDAEQALNFARWINECIRKKIYGIN